MSKLDLDAKEALADSLMTTAMILGGRKITLDRPAPKLLSRHYTVFQVPSSATQNYLHYVVGSRKDGWRCSCVGYQAHGYCYHARAVAQALSSIDTDRTRKRKNVGGGGARNRSAKRGGGVKLPATSKVYRGGKKR